MSDEQDTRDRSAAPSLCSEKTFCEVTYLYEVCDEKDCELYIEDLKGVIRPYRLKARFLPDGREL